MVADFVRKALAAVGVECVERERGLLRVYAHPALEELQAGEAWVELACDDALLTEHPAALLCIPGSYPLDRILALVREMPRAFRFAAALEAPAEVPAKPPGVENAPTSLRLTGSEARAAVRMLARVRIQSDETVEHLVWVAADGVGQDRPDLLPHWDEMPRLAHPELPGIGEMPALERQAEVAAARLGEEYCRSASAHREHERERLEAFHGALLAELPSLVPAGPARRLAEGRAQAQAFADLLRASLPGEGPWSKAELLPRGLWPFRRPGLLPPLPAEERFRLLRLLPHLASEFTLTELEKAVADEAAPRIKRLEERVAADPESRARLTEAERRLREEHEGRMADLERKLQVRTLVTPRLLEELHYSVFTFELRVEGGPNLTAVWDPFAGTWEPMTCPTCGEVGARLWLCGNRTAGCDHCTSRCSGCERVEPRTAPLRACAQCQAPACDACGEECDECGEWGCGQHVFRCPACERTRCSSCGAACGVCTGAACAEHFEICGVCRKTLCVGHRARCVVCEAVVCPDHRSACPICLGACCSPHQVECRLCGQSYCAHCVPAGTCATCRQPEPAAEATAEALRSQVAQAVPELDAARLSGWTLARNARYRVITARAWPWGYRFVLDEETGALLEHSRFLRPF